MIKKKRHKVLRLYFYPNRNKVNIIISWHLEIFSVCALDSKDQKGIHNRKLFRVVLLPM